MVPACEPTLRAPRSRSAVLRDLHRSFFNPGDPIPSSSSSSPESRSDGDRGKCDSGVQTIADDRVFQTWGPSR